MGRYCHRSCFPSWMGTAEKAPSACQISFSSLLSRCGARIARKRCERVLIMDRFAADAACDAWKDSTLVPSSCQRGLALRVSTVVTRTDVVSAHPMHGSASALASTARRQLSLAVKKGHQLEVSVDAVSIESRWHPCHGFFRKTPSSECAKRYAYPVLFLGNHWVAAQAPRRAVFAPELLWCDRRAIGDSCHHHHPRPPSATPLHYPTRPSSRPAPPRRAKVAAAVLAGAGARVAIAYDGKQAVEAFVARNCRGGAEEALGKPFQVVFMCGRPALRRPSAPLHHRRSGGHALTGRLRPLLTPPALSSAQGRAECAARLSRPPCPPLAAPLSPPVPPASARRHQRPRPPNPSLAQCP